MAANLEDNLNENYTVSILNRSVRVDADGNWRIDDIPATFGQSVIELSALVRPSNRSAPTILRLRAAILKG